MNYTDPKTGVRVSTHITQPVEYEAWINGKKVETSSDSMTNEKWWDGEEYAKLYAGQEFCLVHDMDKIVAEATRMGEVKAWSEAGKKVASELTDVANLEVPDNATKQFVLSRINSIMFLVHAKLTSLKTP